ncbi:MAG: tRNA threonylcarbamoyladenosine biosynthesis protein TsaB [Gammaproteobacteria bacterium]|jgi:tRNA threonylcarbamoyladenosine biosynthesis protein TsaB|nr:tRNA threonylcarbamoyladenosine biosynthesis protein TsaB [Gammaproteobacteria bacterium]
MNHYLAIETTTDICAIALSQGLQLAACYHSLARTHAEHILSLIDEIMAKNACDPTHLEAIVVGTGPGSFTGVRLGLSVAQGLGYGFNVPIVPVNSLAVIAQAACLLSPSSQCITVAVNARQGECYYGVFSPDQKDILQTVGEIKLLALSDLNRLSAQGLRVGNAWAINNPEQDHLLISLEALQSYLPEALILQGKQVLSKGGAVLASALKANYVLDALFTLKKQDLS